MNITPVSNCIIGQNIDWNSYYDNLDLLRQAGKCSICSSFGIWIIF